MNIACGSSGTWFTEKPMFSFVTVHVYSQSGFLTKTHIINCFKVKMEVSILNLSFQVNLSFKDKMEVAKLICLVLISMFKVLKLILSFIINFQDSKLIS